MRASILAIAGLALAACTPAQQAKFDNMLTVACEKDGQYQPIALVTLQMAGAAFAPVGQAASLDAVLLHPIVVAACAQHGAKPVIVPATVAPAAVVAPVTVPVPASKGPNF